MGALGAHDASGALTGGRTLEVVVDAIGVVRKVRGGLDFVFPIQQSRTITDQAASWSLSFRQFLARSLEAGVASSGAYLLRDRSGTDVAVHASFGPQGDGTWRLTLEQSASPTESVAIRDAFAIQERVGLVDLVMDLTSTASDVGDSATASLPWIMNGLGMEAAGFYVVRDRSKAELVAAYGRTRRRGFPYPELDLLKSSLRPLLGSQMLELAWDLGDAALRSVACPGAHQIVLIPTASAGVVNGILALSRRDTRPILSEDKQNLLTVGRVLALGARIGELSARSEQSRAVLGTAYAVSRAISQSLDLERTFKQIAINAARLIAGSHCLLLELDPANGDLVAVATSEPDDELVGLRLRFQDVSALASGYLELDVEDLVCNAQVSPSFRSKLKMESAVFLPMLAQNELVGSLLLFSATSASQYSDSDLSLAEEVAEQAAIAIHNARLYKDLADSRASVEGLLARIARVREHERREAAAILHDDVLQSVIGVLFELEGLRGSVDDETASELGHPLAVLRAAVDDARGVIAELRPPQLDHLGFSASLRALATRADVEGPAHVEIRLERLPDIEPEKITALYRIARQALVNAQRHAQADNVWLSVRMEDRGGATWVLLAIADDGVGIEWPQPPESRHFGLSMMEEQAALAGGFILFQARLGGGTIVAAEVPAVTA